ncbi:hypothetical protein AVEN_245607-1 [Araneus ventricosus]|uniref:Uncharacterized protein n=1 Tax=Araneus ventricosus TaxID=182803 RepID=A0A4Y2ITJ9_ARAVE|nr:hypothetical protein AVEN_245607-1 [Araneus ventricosus]
MLIHICVSLGRKPRNLQKNSPEFAVKAQSVYKFLNNAGQEHYEGIEPITFSLRFMLFGHSVPLSMGTGSHCNALKLSFYYSGKMFDSAKYLVYWYYFREKTMSTLVHCQKNGNDSILYQIYSVEAHP